MSTNLKQFKSAISSKELTPASAIHPGEILKDELDAREIKQKDFAEMIGIQPTQLNEIIKGKRGLNTELALLLGKALKMDTEIWQNLQSKYELDLVKVNKKTQERLEAIDQWHMIEPYIPVKFFKKQNVIQGDPTRDIDTIKSIYKVGNFEQLAALYSKSYYGRFRKSEKLSEDKVNIVGWVKLVEYKAAQKVVNEFNIRNFNELVKGLKEIIKTNRNTVSNCSSLLKEFGIKFVINENPSKCPVDGVSFWSEGKPAIAMTLRHNRIDNFAFTLLHELGHVCQHLINDNTAEFIDVDLDICSTDNEQKEEKEANLFAQNTLIDPDRWDVFFSSFSRLQEEAIIAFAEEQDTHPAIVKGRICHELNFYKFKTEKINSELN